MPRLTDSQLVILSTAANRADGAVLPLPTSLKLKGAATSSLLKSLLKHGLVVEQSASPGATAWREAKDGQRFALIVSGSGRAAIGIETGETSKAEKPAAKTRPGKRSHPGRGGARSRHPGSAKANSKRTPKTVPSAATRPGTKQALLLDLLQRKHGASIAEVVKATGWQPHSVRGAVSG